MFFIPRTHNTDHKGFSDYDDLPLGEAVQARHQRHLARGRDHAGNPYAEPTKTYPELARFRAKHGKKGQ